MIRYSHLLQISGTIRLNQVHISLDGFDDRVHVPGLHLLGTFCPFVQMGRLRLDPITDIFRTMHVAAVVHSILEATVPTEWRMQKAVQLLHQNDKN